MKINYSSLSKIAGHNDHVVLYGFRDCKYLKIANKAKKENTHFKQVWFSDDWVNNGNLETMTIDGRKINKIHFTPISILKTLVRQCKTIITNIVLENYKRKREKKNLITVLFFIDITNNIYSTNFSELPLLKTQLITAQEIGRAYSLCCEVGHEKLAKIALQTFKFIKVHKTENYDFEEIPAPWLCAGWDENWRKTPSNAKLWKVALIQHADNYRKKSFKKLKKLQAMELVFTKMKIESDMQIEDQELTYSNTAIDLTMLD